MARRKNRGQGFVIGALVGSMIGVTGALLFAPKRGEEIRQELLRRMNTTTENKPLSHMILEMGSEWADDFCDLDDNNSASQLEDQGGGEMSYVVSDMLDNIDRLDKQRD